MTIDNEDLDVVLDIPDFSNYNRSSKLESKLKYDTVRLQSRTFFLHAKKGKRGPWDTKVCFDLEAPFKYR